MSKLERAVSLKKNSENIGYVGSPEDMIPFAWRQPLKPGEGRKMSRVFKTMHDEEAERASRIPAFSDRD